MSDGLRPAVVSLPPRMPVASTPEWLSHILPELAAAGVATNPEEIAQGLEELVAFGIPDGADACAALVIPGSYPVLLTVLSAPACGNASKLSAYMVDHASDELLNSADDVIEAEGFQVYRSSRVVVPEGAWPRVLAVRGALVVTRPIGGRLRDVGLYFVGNDIDALVTSFLALAAFIVSKDLESLITISESR